jgi:predicted nucleotidyltransferase
MTRPTTEAALDAHIAKALAQDGWVLSTLRGAWPELLAVYAFGSRMQGLANADSDLDLAVLLPGYAAPLKLWELAHQLAAEVGCAVDLLDLRAASTVMQHQVLMHGRKLWSIEPAVGLFEAFLLSEKTQFDEARASLLADIAKNGRVYGG